ncbi:MAG: HAD family phosphatase [Chloroflexi bacterium]|nr:HAD family phosphatase [Chloroflexota bacterium]
MKTAYYQLLALDLDGTLVGADLLISPRVKTALAEAMRRGVRVTLATGRMLGVAVSFSRQLNITTPLICYQGALIQTAEANKPLFRQAVPLPLAREVVEFARRVNLPVGAQIDNSFYVERLRPADTAYIPSVPMEIQFLKVVDLMADLPGDPLKLVIFSDPDTIAYWLPRMVEEFTGRLNVMRSHPLLLEATHPNVSKGRALAWLAAYLGIPRERVMAIGDNDNDADMVAWAGWGVAMGNATPAVKAAADFVAPPLEEDGAAVAIEHFVLGREES